MIKQSIVVKDLSRFGRDYITIGDYISRVFPFLGVRFISVNDGFDSINPQDIDSLDTSFRTLIYDLYSRDLSRKVRSARKARAERGAFLSPYAPYGYIKDPEDKNHLLVDEEAASVIRRIFQRAADGLKTWEIAAELNGDGVISPKNYKIDAGCTRTPWRSIQEDNFWTANLVGKFLRDERYIGKVVFGKRVRDAVGSTHTVKISRNDLIVVPDRHEAIVSESLFEAAQTCMREYRECASPTDSDKPLKRNPMQETGRFRLYVDVLFPEIRLFSFLGNRRLFCQPVRNIDDLNALILVRFISDPGEYQLRISVLDLKKGVYFALKGFLVADVV